MADNPPFRTESRRVTWSDHQENEEEPPKKRKKKLGKKGGGFFFVVVGSVTAVVTTRRSDIVRPTASTSSIQRANDDVQVTFDCRSPAWLGVGLGFFFCWISLGFTSSRLSVASIVFQSCWNEFYWRLLRSISRVKSRS